MCSAESNLLCSLTRKPPPPPRAPIPLPCRFFVMAAFTLLYILTPELLPTRVRGFALGVCNSVSRLGGLVAPFAAVQLLEGGRVRAGVAALVAACAAAAALVAWVGSITRGAELQMA